MISKRGREIHAKGEKAREAGDFVGALKFYDEALQIYSEDKDSASFAEVVGSMFLTYRHLADKQEDQNYLVLAKHAAMAAVEIGEKSAEPGALAMPYFNMAKAQESLGEMGPAVESYKKAVAYIESDPLPMHDRPAVKADFKAHLAIAEIANGSDRGYDMALEAIEVLEKNKEGYTTDVWLSGAHMRLAEVLHDTDAEKALIHLGKAKDIIDSNEKLAIRLEQWERLSASFK